MDRNGRLYGFLVVACALACGALAGPAWASDQFTLDSQPDSFGAIVTDAAGDAYITWDHKASPADVPTFCKLASGAHACTYRVGLTLPSGSTESPLQPFPVVGPNGLVLVIANRYVADDTLIWTSTNGGKNFGAPHDIPLITSPQPGLNGDESYSYAGLTGVDDLVPVNYTNFDLYDEGTAAGTVPGSKTASGVPAVGWIESSTNPGLGWNFDSNNEAYGGFPGVTEFDFNNPGSGGVAGSTIGVSGFGSTSLAATSDWVEAYWLLSTPVSLDYYYYSYTGRGTSSAPPVQGAWSGPHSLGDAYEPRLAGGAAGLFLLSVNAPNGTGPATVVQIRKYDPVTHTFGSPLTLAHEPSGGELFDGGGLGENLETGELAAVWPQFGTSEGDLLRLYLSSDGGKHFSPGQYIANADGFQDNDNARVAVADNGTGFVTFLDDTGLQISDLYPLSSQYHKLKGKKGRHGREIVLVPVTCPAAKGKCDVRVSLARPHKGRPGTLASHHFSIEAGTTTLKLVLDRAGIRLLAADHGRLRAILTLVIRPHGAAAHAISAHVAIN